MSNEKAALIEAVKKMVAITTAAKELKKKEVEEEGITKETETE